jgi:biopolymer transport protein ExbD
MKMAGAKQVHYDSGPNMTPLVDVVMVILIFLMLAGSFGTSEHFMASKTPIHAQGGGGQPPPPGWEPPKLLEVRVNDAGDFTLSGVMEGSRLRVMNKPEQLKQQLEAKVAEFGSTEKVEVVLRPGSNTRWESLAPLYDAALRAKYEKVSFAMTGS